MDERAGVKCRESLFVFQGIEGACAVESRSMNVTRGTVGESGSGPPATRAMSTLPDAPPFQTRRQAITLSAGQYPRASAMSSKPTPDESPGTPTPSTRGTCRTPIARTANNPTPAGAPRPRPPLANSRTAAVARALHLDDGDEFVVEAEAQLRPRFRGALGTSSHWSAPLRAVLMPPSVDPAKSKEPVPSGDGAPQRRQHEGNIGPRRREWDQRELLAMNSANLS